MTVPITQLTGFDPEFDDTEWTSDWLHVPIAQVPPGEHSSGYRIQRRVVEFVEVFGRPYRLTTPMECRLLFDPNGRLWMSDTPQERIMMYNNGRRSQGHVLVGGLGLGLYPQFAVLGAVGQATRFTIVERSSVVRDIVEPTLRVALDVPLEVKSGDVLAYLSGPVTIRYDTIFLDTWENLDPIHLPEINRLRDLALNHLAIDGRVVLWGYRWMVRLFEQACQRLLEILPGQRRTWLAAQDNVLPQALELLMPILDHFETTTVDDPDQALAWCRHYIVHRTSGI